jgi:hypothetical protein
MPDPTWRDHCRPTITAVIQRVGTEDRKTLQLALDAAYPRDRGRVCCVTGRDDAYDVWCDEVRRQQLSLLEAE